MGLVMVAGSLGMSQHAEAACLRDERVFSVRDRGRQVDLSSLPVSDPFRRFVDGLLPVLGRGAHVTSGLLEWRFLRRRLGEAPGEAITEPEDIRFQSPWLEVRRFAGEPCRTAMTFLWDERQMLVDQVLLSGGSLGASQPVTPAALTEWLRAYETAAFRVSPGERERRVAALSRGMPSEILWLFENSVQSTRGPFAGYVSDGLANLQSRAEPAYRTLAAALVAVSLSADAPRIIRDIRQAAPFFDIQSLRAGTIR